MGGLVSVVVPTYERNDSLRETLDSVSEQTYSPVECIVVDGSEDRRARSVAERYDVRYLHQSDSTGAHAARSIGAERADGEYVQFLDDDDRLRPSKIRRQVSQLENSEAGVSYCGLEWGDGTAVLPDPRLRGDVLDDALKFNLAPCITSTMLVDASVLREFLPLPNRHGADDVGMKIELAKRTPFEFVDEPLVLRGESDDSLGGSRAAVEGRYELLDRYADLYERRPSRVGDAAEAYAYLLDARYRVVNDGWSLRASTLLYRAFRSMPGTNPQLVAAFVASLLGRPGWRLGRRLQQQLQGRQRRGKIV